MVVAQNSVNSVMAQKIIQTGTKYASFTERLLKFDLRVRDKVLFLISLKGAHFH